MPYWKTGAPQWPARQTSVSLVCGINTPLSMEEERFATVHYSITEKSGQRKEAR